MLKRVTKTALKWKKDVQRQFFPLRRSLLSDSFDKLIYDVVGVLFVHSSLSACGFIPGGPETVVSSLRSKCNTLVLPTHTYCYPATKKSVGPAYNPSITPSAVGAISNWFWQQPNVVRSLHPTHSLAAVGPQAREICVGHEKTDTPCGAGTPYQRLIDQRAAVLMFGCTMNTYTLFHTSEDLAQCSYLYYPEQVNLSYIDANGQTVETKMWRQNMEYARRFTEMEEELELKKLLVSMTLREGKLLFIPSSLDVHNYLMDRLAINPRHLLKDS